MQQYSIKDSEGKLILIATILASGMAFLDSSVINIAIPTLQLSFQASLISIQWVINGYLLMLCSLLLLSGALGDKFGRKKIFVYGIGVFIFSSFLCSISQSIQELILFRCLQGIGGAMMVPGSLSIINVSFEESIRGRAIGLWSGFAGGVAALGPFAGGWLVQTLGWRSIFYINIPLGLLALVIAIRYIPETENTKAARIDWMGALLIFLSLLGITYGLISGSNMAWTNPRILMSLIGGCLLFILFIRMQLKEENPLIPCQIFTKPLVAGANLVTLFLYFALSSLIFFLVLNFQQVQHYSPIMAGLGMLPSIILVTFLSGMGGTLADKIGPRIPMIVGSLLVAFGMFILILPGQHANYFLQYLPGLLLFGLGMSFVIAPLTKSALSVAPQYSGAASGVNNAVARVAGLLAVALLGAIVLSFFKIQLEQRISTTQLLPIQQQQIISQDNKLMAIDIPKSFSNQAKSTAENAIENSFIYAFRWAMAINVFLALLSAIVAFFMIKDNKLIPRKEIDNNNY